MIPGGPAQKDANFTGGRSLSLACDVCCDGQDRVFKRKWPGLLLKIAVAPPSCDGVRADSCLEWLNTFTLCMTVRGDAEAARPSRECAALLDELFLCECKRIMIGLRSVLVWPSKVVAMVLCL